jgi:hypothetical protein
MGESFQTMLDFRELSETYRSAPTLQGTPFTDNFFSNPQPTTADEIEVYRIQVINKPAPGNTRGSNPRQFQSPSMDKILYALFYSFNELEIREKCLKFLMATDPDIQRIGREILDEQLASAGTQQKLFREVVLQQIFTSGRVNLAANGEILVPSIDAATGVITDNAETQQSIDFGIPDTRRGDCDDKFGTAGGGFWDAADTLIFQQLANARDAALKAGSMPFTTVWLNKLRAPALINNTQFKLYAANNNVRNEAVLQGGGVDNLWGFNFKFLEGYWTDKNGVQRPIIPLRGAILSPDGDNWYRKKEGTEMIPTQVGIMSDFEAGLRARKAVVGMFAFAQARATPLLKLSQYYGDNFGVGFPDPKVLWFPTVFSA